MKIYKLDPNPSLDATGGNKVETLIIEAMNECNDERVLQITDEIMGVGEGKIDKLLSYWRNTKLISDADVILANTADRRACFFLHHLKKKNPNITIVTTHHHFAYLMFDKGSKQRALIKFYENNIIRNSDIIAVSGQYPYEMTLKMFPEKIVIHTGVPIPRDVTTVSNLIPGKLLFIGTVEPRKGLHFLIKALGQVDEDFHLSIAGNYNGHKKYYNYLMNLVNEYDLGGKIEFLGRISDEEKEELLRQAYTFVFPTQNEGYGMVLLEAMGHGVPVVAFNNSSIPYIVNDQKNGLLVDNLNVDDLALKITFVLQNPDEVRRMGENGLQTYQNSQTVDEFKNGIKELYKTLEIMKKG